MCNWGNIIGMKITGFKINKKQFITVALLIMFVFLMMDFNSRLSELSRQNARRDQVKTEVQALMWTEEALKGQVLYATSEAAVEDWAREQGHMSLPGDVVIIPLPEGEVVERVILTPVPTAKPLENWEVWRMLLLGR
jgi:cell division protein FtsB